MAISSSLLSTTTTNTSSSSSSSAAAAGTKHHSSQRTVRHHRHHQESAKDEHQQQKKRRKKKKQAAAAAPPPPLPLPKPPSSWSQFKSLLTCKSLAPTQVHDPSTSSVVSAAGGGSSSRYGKLSSSCSSICTLKDVVVHGNTRVVHRGESDHSPPDTASSNCSGQLGPEARLLSSRSSTAARSTTSRPASGASHHGSRGMPPLRKLSGCYECRAISDPIRYPMPRSTICTCPDCGEVFTKPENLEQHQIVRHAVSELGPEDSGRNIVEIIFKSSWVKRDLTAIDGTHPVLCKIDRILKVHNTQRTVTRFEEYREAVKSRAAMMLLHSSSAAATAASRCAAAAGKKNPRCAADGNELLRFHCATVSCSLGARGSNSLCSGSSSGSCGVCSVIRHGFARAQVEQGKGVRTTASSGRAHDCCAAPLLGEADGPIGTRRAMLVCRVIAGRIKRAADDPAGPDDDLPGSGGYDSVAGGGGRQTHFGSGGAGGKAGSGGGGGGYGNLEELFVANPRAILPCFVVIYRTIG